MSTAHPPSPKNGHNRYEKSDVGFRFALVFITALIAVVVVILIVLTWFYRIIAPKPQLAASTQTADAPRMLPPEPRLQSDPVQDMIKHRAEEEQKMKSYGWVDSNAGIARIPVDRALQLTAERGLPQWQAPKPATSRRQP